MEGISIRLSIGSNANAEDDDSDGGDSEDGRDDEDSGGGESDDGDDNGTSDGGSNYCVISGWNTLAGKDSRRTKPL